MAIDIGSILLTWENAGVFEFLLPFLLVFAIVFGILSATNILGSNRGIHVVIALIIGVMSVGYSISVGFSLGQFLGDLFPRLAIGLAVLITLLILVGLFIAEDEMRYWGWGLGAIGALVGIIIIAQSFERFSWYAAGGYGEYAGWIIGAVLLLGIIVAIGASGAKKDENKERGKAAYKLFRS